MYTTKSIEFKADFAEVMDRFDSQGTEAALRRAGQICDLRKLKPTEALTLLDEVRRTLGRPSI